MITTSEWRLVLLGAFLGVFLGWDLAHHQAASDIDPVVVRDASLILHPQVAGVPVGQGSGTAWDVNGELKVTTAAHVVAFREYVIGIHGGRRLLFQVVYVNLRTDFAILEPVETNPDFDIDPLPFKLGEPKYGGAVWYSGSPNGKPHLVLHGHYAGDVFENGVRFRVFDSFAWKGSSGSAVVDSRGGLLGSVSHIDVDVFNGDPVLIPNLVFAALEAVDVAAMYR